MIDKEWAYNNGFIAPVYLRDDQLKLYLMLLSMPTVISMVHRRWGKTTTYFSYIFDECKNALHTVRYLAPTQKLAHEIYGVIENHIFKGHENMKPKWYNQDGAYYFKSGSKIIINGGKDQGEIDKAGRGGEADIIYVDEFGFFRHKAEYLLTSVLSPQLDTFPDPKLFITSTVPEDLTHEFINQVALADEGGYLFKHTIDDSLRNGTVSQAKHKAILDRVGGLESDAYKREYQCLLIPPKDRLVIPEALDDSLYAKTEIIQPPYLNWCCFIDMALKDLFAALYMYIDFRRNKLCVVKEYAANYKTTKEIVENLKVIESELGIESIIRRADNSNLQQIFDMTNDYKFPVTPIIKSSKSSTEGFRESVINELRINVGTGQIEILKAACPKLCKQLKYGIWKENRADFERQKNDDMGHLDCLMALAYGNYMIDWKKNPYPIIPTHVKENEHSYFIRPGLEKDISFDTMLGRKKN